nr:sigma-70 family RNA polymerase sigma factor [Ornithinibacillus caprae]
MYLLYFKDIYRFLLSLTNDHYTAEDLVQETFFRAYLYLEKFHAGNVKTWLFTVAHRAFVDYYRKHKRIDVKEEDFFRTRFEQKQTTEAIVVLQEDILEIRKLLKDLPEKHKFAVLLHDFHELTYDEAAQVMNVKKSHFKVLLFRGRQAIRNRKVGEYERRF